MSVTDSDGVTESATLKVTVSKASQRALPTLTVAKASVARSSGIAVTGTGFAAGAISGTVPVPTSASNYDTVTAFGVISAVPAVGSMSVTG